MSHSDGKTAVSTCLHHTVPILLRYLRQSPTTPHPTPPPPRVTSEISHLEGFNFHAHLSHDTLSMAKSNLIYQIKDI